LLLVLLFCIHATAATPPHATAGILDLRNWHWRQDGPVPLHGQWAFHWKQLLSPAAFPTQAPPTAYVDVPNPWNGYVPGPWHRKGQGYATYRLKVLLPKDNSSLALKYTLAVTAMEVYANGHLLVRQGKVGTSPETMTPDYRPGYVPLPLQGDTLELVAHVSNFHYFEGGLWDTFTIGPEEHIQKQRIASISRDFFVVGCFVIMGLYHLCAYFFMRQAKALMLFAVFCFLLAVRITVTGEFVIHVISPWNWWCNVHTEFLSLYLGVPTLVAFSFYLFPAEFSRRVLRVLVGVSAVFVLAVLVLPPYAFTHTLPFYQVLMLVSLGYGLSVYVRAWRNKREGGGYFLVGFLVLGLCIVNDILYTTFIIESVQLFYVGLFFFILSQAAMLTKRFSRAFFYLQNANQELESANEEVHRQNEQLTNLNNELDSLVYRVSHDLRSPVASVMGLIGIARLEKDSGRIMEYMDLQEKTLHRMDAFIRDIISYSRNKRTSLSPQPVDFESMVKDVFADHSHLENAEKIEKTVQVNQPGDFVSDKRRLSIVLSNLLSNAIRYHDTTKPRPEITISVATDARQARIEIRDNGQGIGPEHVGRVFEMFYRANEKTKGSGLGLYLVKEAVEKMGGSISVESQLGTGTTFFITLPNLKPQ
jgi:signal transduction histidine kinase